MLVEAVLGHVAHLQVQYRLLVTVLRLHMFTINFAGLRDWCGHCWQSCHHYLQLTPQVSVYMSVKSMQQQLPFRQVNISFYEKGSLDL
jgi:hypothetical protein